jgi:hypothetical protein
MDTVAGQHKNQSLATTKENLPFFPLNNNDAIWILESLAWDEFAFSQHYVQSLNKFMPT